MFASMNTRGGNHECDDAKASGRFICILCYDIGTLRKDGDDNPAIESFIKHENRPANNYFTRRPFIMQQKIRAICICPLTFSGCSNAPAAPADSLISSSSEAETATTQPDTNSHDAVNLAFAFPYLFLFLRYILIGHLFLGT